MCGWRKCRKGPNIWEQRKIKSGGRKGEEREKKAKKSYLHEALIPKYSVQAGIRSIYNHIHRPDGKKEGKSWKEE